MTLDVRFGVRMLMWTRKVTKDEDVTNKDDFSSILVSFHKVLILIFACIIVKVLNSYLCEPWKILHNHLNSGSKKSVIHFRHRLKK